MPILPQPTVRRQQYRDGVTTSPAVAMAASATTIAVAATPAASTNVGTASKLAFNQQPPLSPSVSKIPRQVHGTNKMPIEGPKLQYRYYQQRHDSPSIENGASHAEINCYKSNKVTTNPNYNKYLTFNKDQAASHFNALKQELGVQVSPPISPKSEAFVISSKSHQLDATTGTLVADREEPDSSSTSATLFDHQEPRQSRPPPYQPPPLSPDTTGEPQVTTSNTGPHPGVTYRTTSPIARPRLSKQKQQQTPDDSQVGRQRDDFPSEQATNDNNTHYRAALHKPTSNGSEASLSQAQPQQQPTCEAFIMTGQSMLKLSCNESELRGSVRRVSNNLKPNNISNITTTSSNQINQNKCSSGNNNNNSNNNNNNNTHSIENIVDSLIHNDTKHHNHLDSSRLVRASEQLNSSSIDQLEAKSGVDIARLVQSDLEHSPHRQTSQRVKSHSLDKLSSGCGVGRNTSDDDAAADDLCPRQATPTAALAPTLPTTTTGADSGDKDSHWPGLQLKHERDRDTESQQQHQQARQRTEAGGQFVLLANSNQSKRQIIAPLGGDSLDSSAACGQQQQQQEYNDMKDIHKTRRNQDQQPLVISDQQEEDSDIGAGHLGFQQSDLSLQKKPQNSTTIMDSVASLDSPKAPIDYRAMEPSQAGCQERESARRLAKRLYNLSGFKKSDVCHHLSKSNPFSQMVAEEYLNLFDFRTMKLDAALRKFLSKLQLNGETQERERMLGQFSKRYYDCNKDKFPNADTVQTLVCALILLNTDLNCNHLDRGRGKNKRSKLSLGAFIDGLNNSLASAPNASVCAGQLNNITTTHPASSSTSVISNSTKQHQQIAYTFPRHLLVDLYESIKKRPIKYVEDKCDMTSFEAELDRIYGHHQSATSGASNNRSNTLPTRRFAPGSNAPSSTMSASSRRQLKRGLNKMNGSSLPFDDPEFAIEFKSGFLHRKRVFEPQGKPTSKGRRGWRQAYFLLQDLRLIMRYDYQPSNRDPEENKEPPGSPKAGSEVAKPQQSHKIEAKLLAQDLKNTVRIHHTFAKRSTIYKKRENVFHLKLADQSEYLIQASSEAEMSAWIDTINFASACFSSPALPSAVTNGKRYQQQRQHRPILPASYTKLSYWEQLIDHEERLQRLKVELEEHLNEAPNTKNASKRYQTEFIEKIAYLKHEIERYSVYVDLMRKKSNSPEAIVLSKHPQIGCLKPSEEMIKSLPSFAPQKLVENIESINGHGGGQKQDEIKIESIDTN